MEPVGGVPQDHGALRRASREPLSRSLHRRRPSWRREPRRVAPNSCVDYFQSIDDPFGEQLQEAYSKKFPGTNYLFTAGSASTGMYRGVKFYEAAVKATGGKLGREEVAAAMDVAKLDQGPGGGAEMVPGKMHCKMNMYLAVCKVDSGGKTHYDVVSKADMVDPKEC